MVAKTTNKAICLEAEVTINAAATDAEVKGPATFDVLAYTGGAVEVAAWDLPVVIDLDGMTFSRSLVANLDHDSSKRVGNVTDKSKTDGKLTLSGKASAATAARDEVVASARDGFVWQASIEARPTKVVEVPTGQTVEANGRTFTGPLYLAKKSTLKGFAFVSHGADDNTDVSIAASADSKKKGREMKLSAEAKTWFASMVPGFNFEDADDNQLAMIQANYEGRNKTTPPKALELVDEVEKLKAENARAQKIIELTREAIGRNPYAADEIRAMAEKAISDKWPIQQYELELLRSERPQAANVFSTRDTSPRLTNQVVEAAICQSLHLPGIEKKFPERTLEAADAEFHGRIGLKQLFLIAASANGYRTGHSQEVTLEVQRAAFGMLGRREVHAAGFSTISLPGILSNTMNKFVREAFMNVDQTWRAISAVRPVNDFKQISTYSLTGDLDYEQIGPAGEIKHGTLGEETYTNQALTYAKLVAITRTDIINDDLGALMAVPRRLGRGGATKLNNVFWTMFLNNSSFFAAGNNNVSAGALNTANLTAAEVVFMNQTDPDGQPLGAMPAILLVPPTLKNTALALMNSMLVVNGGTNTTIPSGNVFEGRYRVASSPYMENASYTGNSTTAYYLLADPNDIPVIETVFLNGRDMPVVETAEAEFDTLGVQTRAYHDFGVNLQEYRGGVRSTGA